MPFDGARGFEPKEALERWKKAKPLTMPETGVGELLKALPPSPAPGQLSKYVEIQGKLKAKLADPKVKAVPKAAKCIESINEDISAFLKWYKESRVRVIGKMTLISQQIAVFQGVLEQRRDQPDKLQEAYYNVLGVARQNSVDSRSYPSAGSLILPQNVYAAWLGVTNTWAKSVSDTIQFLNSKPTPDPHGAEALSMTKDCKQNGQRVSAVAALLKPI